MRWSPYSTPSICMRVSDGSFDARRKVQSEFWWWKWKQQLKNQFVVAENIFVGTAHIHMPLERKHMVLFPSSGDPFWAHFCSTDFHLKTDTPSHTCHIDPMVLTESHGKRCTFSGVTDCVLKLLNVDIPSPTSEDV